jgi:hypothetical protein
VEPAVCSDETGTCQASFVHSIEPDTGKYPLFGDCVFEQTVKITFDGEIDHVPDQKELTAVCMNFLSEGYHEQEAESATHADALLKGGEVDLGPDGDDCSQSHAGRLETAGVIDLFRLIFTTI